MTGHRVLSRIALLAMISMLSACSMFDFLRADRDESLEPAPLEDFDEEVRLNRLWDINVGSGQGDKFNRLKPVLANNRIYAASNDGVVMAVDVENGRALWRERLDYAITGGVGFGNGMVLVGSENSEVVALDAETGEELWVAVVSSEVLSAPVVGSGVVVAQSVDGKLAGLDAETGERIWLYENNVPDLSLRGTSGPLVLQNFVLAAFANGRVVSVALDNGTLRWDERVALPTGRSEIERLVDIDGELVINDAGLLLVPSYQGFFAALDPVTGQTRWRVEESSEVAAGFGFGNVYVVDEDDIVKAFRTGQDTAVWTNESLRMRKLSAPLGFSNYVAVGDLEGYVHLLAQSDGRFVGRTRTDRDGIRARMLSQGNTLYVFGNSGDLTALRVEAR